jgi:hypothetical protein
MSKLQGKRQKEHRADLARRAADDDSDIVTASSQKIIPMQASQRTTWSGRQSAAGQFPANEGIAPRSLASCSREIDGIDPAGIAGFGGVPEACSTPSFEFQTAWLLEMTFGT